MKLLVDMNLSPRWVDHLRGAGFDAVHWSELGPATAADGDIMAFAAAKSFVIFTHDLDFSAILAASGRQAPSVVQLRSARIVPEEMGPMVTAALSLGARYLATGALLTIDPVRSRLRVLPLCRAVD